LPIAADFAFHFSDATSRYEVPHDGAVSGVWLFEEVVIGEEAFEHGQGTQPKRNP
jgi:hypothetical protein